MIKKNEKSGTNHYKINNINSIKKRIFRILLFSIWIFSFSFSQNINFSKESYISFKGGENMLCLSAGKFSVPLVINSNDFAGVIRAAKNLQQDIFSVSGAKPEICFDNIPDSKNPIIIGTIGKSSMIDNLIKEKKIDVSDIKDKWETFIIQVVDNPYKDITKALVIAGSDKRGTIYGMYDLAEKIGVSPWRWWADVPVRKHAEIYVMPGKFTLGEPKVKYRGIFINDEAPALSGWVEKNYGKFNHQFYEHVFDLILRLKGNYLWPAMWGRSLFVDDTLTPGIADEYGVVIGTSHHEPCMRAHVEWGRGPGTWNYQKNEQALKEFWTEGIKRMKNYESIVTVGMRGDGDEPMTEDANIELLQRIVRDQRKIISDVTGKDASEVPQLWALYKEVQEYYDKGMRVPDDITLLLCDDNWGNIRKLPKLEDKPRKGGYGIYYHFDYVGDPRNYKWLNTNQISRVWEQMHLAYEYGVNKIWIVNVGDIKPMEFPIDFFLNYAWNPDKWTNKNISDYAMEWAEKIFGTNSKEIADIMTEYTRYNSRRKPELLSGNTYSLNNFREFETVVSDYNNLLKRTEKINASLSKEYKDAFFQLVLHPVSACANINEMYYKTGKNHLYAEQGRTGTNELSEEVLKLFKQDSAISYYYNNLLSGGKWNHMMDQKHISYSYWQQPDEDTVPKTKQIPIPSDAEMGVSPEGTDKYFPADNDELLLPEFDVFNKQQYYIEIFNRGSLPFEYSIESGKSYVKINRKKGSVKLEDRVWVSIDWKTAPEGKNKIPIVISGSDKTKSTIYAIINNVPKTEIKDVKGFAESNGYISIEAEHYSKAVNNNGISWEKIPDLGRTLSGITSFPVTKNIQKPGDNTPHLEYEIYLFNPGEIEIKTYLSPTLNFPNGQGLRFAVSIDDEEPLIINMHSGYNQNKWQKNVAENINIQTSKHVIKETGKHTLKYWLVDPGVVLQKLIIWTSAEKPCYLGPPESIKY
jgi:hypothetical protein